jgi:hypothetical protein
LYCIVYRTAKCLDSTFGSMRWWFGFFPLLRSEDLDCSYEFQSGKRHRHNKGRCYVENEIFRGFDCEKVKKRFQSHEDCIIHLPRPTRVPSRRRHA